METFSKHHRTILLEVIRCIPSHREGSKSAEEIVNFVAEKLSVHKEAVIGTTYAVLEFFNLFDLLYWENNVCQIKNQTSNYFRNSLCWYLENNQKLLANWDRPGVVKEITNSNILESAPVFLKIVEERRIALSKQSHLDAGHSRTQPVVVTLIKGTDNDESYFLHQWDKKANQYELIGGKVRLDENHIDTARREIQEEVAKHDLVYEKDYSLKCLSEKPITRIEISRTYGALTLYEFWLYEVVFKTNNLVLTDDALWISIEEMKKGVTGSGKKIRDPEVHRIFDAEIPGGMEKLISSVEISKPKNSRLLDFLEIKPSLYGITVDVKAILQHLKRAFRKTS